MAYPFFGLTLAKKEDLFLREIDYLCEQKHWSYWDVYELPVPIRKWFIRQAQERAEKANGTQSSTEPLSPAEKQKMISQAQRATNNPARVNDIMNPVRNKK